MAEVQKQRGRVGLLDGNGVDDNARYHGEYGRQQQLDEGDAPIAPPVDGVLDEHGVESLKCQRRGARTPAELNAEYCTITIIIIIIIISIYHTRTEHKTQKLNSVNKSTEGYQKGYSSLNWPPMLIKQSYLT